VAVILTPYIERIGTTIGPLARRLFQGRRTKKWIRTWYALKALRDLKRTAVGRGADDPATAVWQAGMSVETVDRIEPVPRIMERFGAAARARAGRTAVDR
jgi:nitronate monooxygenase